MLQPPAVKPSPPAPHRKQRWKSAANTVTAAVHSAVDDCDSKNVYSGSASHASNHRLISYSTAEPELHTFDTFL